MWHLWIVFFGVLLIKNVIGQVLYQTPAIGTKGTKCYDDYNRPQVNIYHCHIFFTITVSILLLNCVYSDCTYVGL